MIAEEQLAEWETLCDKASPLPWECLETASAEYAVLTGDTQSEKPTGICYSPRKKDLRFCAAAREAVPALIAEVHRLRAELDKVSDERSDFGVIGYFQGRSDARDRVRQIEKEAEWLASKLADYCNADNDWSCHGKTKDDCIKCIIKEARDATQE